MLPTDCSTTSDDAPEGTHAPLFHGRPGAVADRWDQQCDGADCVEGVLDLLIVENASLCADLRDAIGPALTTRGEEVSAAEGTYLAFTGMVEQLTAFRNAYVELQMAMGYVLGRIHSPRDMPPEIAKRVAQYLAIVRAQLPDLAAGSKVSGGAWHELCQLTDPSTNDDAAAFRRFQALVAAAGPDEAAQATP